MQDLYGAILDKIEKNMSWDTWVKETKMDDDRHYQALVEVCKGKHVLEFGCGNGGFLRRIRNVAASVTGIELMDEARENIQQEGIAVHKSLKDVDGKYDVICMFMVIEHLNNPDEILRQIYSVLNENGLFICETCNVEDALISKYKSSDFENFTYWSEHVYLFNSDTLEKLLRRNGFKTKWNTQVQRYSLANHLYWLSMGKPGGHMKWIEFSDAKLNDVYAEKLIELKIADTLWYEGIK